MSDSPEKALKEAEAWLVSAKDKLIAAQEDEELSSVTCAQVIHAIIRANDALTLHHLGIKATRHDDIVTIFSRLIREGKISKSNELFKDLLARVVKDKGGADYGKKEFTLEDAQEYVEKGEEFVNAVKTALKL